MPEDLGVEQLPFSESDKRGRIVRENVAVCMRFPYWDSLSSATQEFCIDLLCKDPSEITTKQFNRLHQLANPSHWAGSELERSAR
jgi:hypothetical protein